MIFIKSLGKEFCIYAPFWVYLTLFGGFWNEAFNTLDLLFKKKEKRSLIPVFLIPGTLGGRGTLLVLKRRLKKYFKNVFIFKPLRFELISREKNAQRLHAFIDVKLKLTRQDKFLVLGHSQGGLIGRQTMNLYDPGGEKTLQIVTIGTPSVGTWAAAVVLPIMWWARALWQLLPPFAADIDQSPSAKKTLSFRGKYDPAFFSWPYKARNVKEYIISGMHISPIFERQAFDNILQHLIKIGGIKC